MTWTTISLISFILLSLADETHARLVGSWPLSAASGFKDASGNGNDGIAHGHVTLAPGVNGEPDGSMVFGGNNYIEIPASKLLDVQYSITLMLWFYDVSTDRGPLVTYEGNDTHAYGTSLYHKEGEFAVMQLVSRDGQNTTHLTSSQLLLNEWDHITGTYDYPSGTLKLYKNAELTAEATGVQVEQMTNSKISIGAANGLSKLKGRIACVRIYNNALTQPQIAAAMKSCSASAPNTTTTSTTTTTTPTTASAPKATTTAESAPKTNTITTTTTTTTKPPTNTGPALGVLAAIDQNANTTNVSASNYSPKVICTDKTMTLIVDTDKFSGVVWEKIAVNNRYEDPGCRAIVDTTAGKATFMFELGRCGTTISAGTDSNTIIYTNYVFTNVDQGILGNITRGSNYDIHVTCTYEIIQPVQEIVFKGNVTGAMLHASGSGSLTIEQTLYSDDQYFKPIQEDEHLYVSERVYASVKLLSDSGHLALRVKSCVAVPKVGSDYSHELIRDRCLSDPTVVFEGESATEYRYSFQSFRFIAHAHDVSIRCSVLICPNTNTDNCGENPKTPCQRKKRRDLIGHQPINVHKKRPKLIRMRGSVADSDWREARMQ